MIPVNLYAKNGEFVATVMVPPFEYGFEADVLVWGDRHFLRDRDSGRYRECSALVAFTREELHEAVEQGIAKYGHITS